MVAGRSFDHTGETGQAPGGGPEGKSWRSDVADDDWAALMGRRHMLFVAFQQASVKKVADSVEKASKMYIKEAQDAGVAADAVMADVGAAGK